MTLLNAYHMHYKTHFGVYIARDYTCVGCNDVKVNCDVTSLLILE